MYIVGAVLSQSEGFTSIGTMWGAFAFHAVFTGVGTALVAKAAAAKRAV